MDPALAIDYTSLLPRAQHPVFHSLEGRLKDIFIFSLLPALQGIHIEIAIISLDILAYHPKPDESFRKQRERFFVGLLAEVNPEVKDTLEKVLKVTKIGFLGELLSRVDSKKKDYPPPKEIARITKEFLSKSLPGLRKQAREKRIIAKDEKLKDTSSIVRTYDALMGCRTYFAFPKLANQFLDFLPFHQKWRKEIYDYFFNLLNIEYHLIFDDFEKLELSKAVFHLHSPRRQTSFGHSSEVDLSEFVDLSSQLKYRGGEELLQSYLASLSQVDDPNIDEMIPVLRLLLTQLDKNSFFPLIKKWEEQKFDWNHLIQLLEVDLVEGGLDMESDQEDIQQRLMRFKADPTVEHPLSDAELKIIGRQYQAIDQLCKTHSRSGFNQLMNFAHDVRRSAQQGPIQEEDRLLLFAIGRLGVRIQFGIYLYSTQILALLGLLVDGKNRQGQVITGQGKTMIVALWAFVMAMECRAGDIITPTRYLAVRDHEKCANFFKRCGITTGHICYNDKVPSHFAAQILYGPSFDFEFAWMEDLLWGKKLYQQRLQNPYVSRNFDAACVDESDNLLIDTARNGARLASPAEVSYDWVYTPILTFVRSNRKLVEQNIKGAVSHIRGYLKSEIAEQNQNAAKQLKNKQLKLWMKSAHHALFELNEQIDYVIKTKRDEEGQLVRVVQIVDLKTGRISENSRWSNGIHEFLEVKHDIVVQKESLTPISLSHAVFYPFYKTISALTGTAERFQTKEIYGIETFDVPTHQPLKRIDLPPIIAKNTAHYYEIILQKTEENIQEKRPLLILCATIQATNLLADRMKAHGIDFKLLNEMQEELEEVILSQAGGAGKVTIATNTAGRGTDIILTQESLQNGGLFVLPVFYFDSIREKDQGIGRGGRQGQPGKSQMILNREDPLIQDLIVKEGRDLADHEIIELLNKQRDLREKSQASMHMAFANLERFLASKTQQFFEFFRNWADFVDQDHVLESFAQKLTPIKLNSNKVFNFDHLNDADLLIAKECIRLLQEKSGMLPWKVFLQKASERMKQKVINDWVKIFYESAETKLRRSGMEINLLRSQIEKSIKAKKDFANQDQDQLSALFAQLYVKALDKQMDLTKEEVTQQFDAHRTQWEKYLAKDGSGLFVYLKEITTVDLQKVVFRSGM